MASPVIKVITDSTCDLPRDWAAEWDVTIIPTVVNFEDHSLLDDGVQLRREEFYQRLPALKALPTTSACPLGLTRDVIAHKAAEADHLVMLTAPARLSSIHHNFRLAAEEVAPGRYTLIDSGQLSMGLGWIVLAAAQAAANRVGLEVIKNIIQSVQERVRVFAALSTLENLRKSGRVSWALAMAGAILQIKPLIALRHGEVLPLERVRTFKRATERLLELGRQHAPLERLAVLHTNNLSGAQAVRAALQPICTPEQTVIVDVTPAIGTHVGPSGLGLAFVTQE